MPRVPNLTNIGDVAAPNLIFQEVLESDDLRFVARWLGCYAISTDADVRQVQQKVSSFGSVNGIPLIEDNHKLRRLSNPLLESSKHLESHRRQEENSGFQWVQQRDVCSARL